VVISRPWYISDQFIADTEQTPQKGKSAQEMSQAFLDHSQAMLADPVAPGTRKDYGFCERNRYCLGYAELFQPNKPMLTDMLLLIVPAQQPLAAATLESANFGCDRFSCRVEDSDFSRRRMRVDDERAQRTTLRLRQSAPCRFRSLRSASTD
jgi:hypothetical protein